MNELSSYFSDVIGYTSIKAELIQIADVLRNADVYRKLGVSAPNGLCLHGEPGVGKTLMASSLVKASGRPSFICRKDKPNGDFTREIKEMFDQAIEHAPSIILLDDMDKFANGDPRFRDAEEYVMVQSCIDDCKNKGADVFVLATANNIHTLPFSLLRAGRFDRVIEVGSPSGKDAVDIVAHYIADKNFDEHVNPEKVAMLMDGRSCAQLEMCINAAGMLAGFRRAEKITMDDFTAACLRNIYDVPVDQGPAESFGRAFTVYSVEGELDRICYHEAGHAVISEVLNPGSVVLVSAHSHDGSGGGLTAYHKNTSMQSLEYATCRVISTLGGRAAIEQKFGEADGGSSKDLDQAYELVFELVTHECICGFGLHESCREDSPQLLRETEQAIGHEMERLYRKAKEILSKNADYLEAVARALKAKGLLTMDDLQNLKDGCCISQVA